MTSVNQPQASDVPATQVVGHIAVPASGVACWRSVWSLRHTVALVVGIGALFAILVSARAPQAGVEYGFLAVAAVIGAVTLATYVPPLGVRAGEHLPGGTCAVMPALAVVVAPVLLSGASATVVPLVALILFTGVAAAKRIMDHASC